MRLALADAAGRCDRNVFLLTLCGAAVVGSTQLALSDFVAELRGDEELAPRHAAGLERAASWLQLLRLFSCLCVVGAACSALRLCAARAAR
jgi:hypothetical protein